MCWCVLNQTQNKRTRFSDKSHTVFVSARCVCVCAYIASTDMREAAAGGLLAAAGDAAPAAAAAQQQLRPGLADIGDIHPGMYFLILIYVFSYC